MAYELDGVMAALAALRNRAAQQHGEIQQAIAVVEESVRHGRRAALEGRRGETGTQEFDFQSFKGFRYSLLFTVSCTLVVYLKWSKGVSAFGGPLLPIEVNCTGELP